MTPLSRIALLALFATAAGGAGAAPAEHGATALNGAAFEVLVTGRTLAFGQRDAPYGMERYLPGRRVIWAYSGDLCRHGTWYEDAPGRICFVYEHDPEPQCWRFYRGADGVFATFEGEGGGLPVAVHESETPLVCHADAPAV